MANGLIKLYVNYKTCCPNIHNWWEADVKWLEPILP